MSTSFPIARSYRSVLQKLPKPTAICRSTKPCKSLAVRPSASHRASTNMRGTWKFTTGCSDGSFEKEVQPDWLTSLAGKRSLLSSHAHLIYSTPLVANGFLSEISATAQISRAYRPKGTPSKMVDFCICIKPSPSVASRIDAMCRTLPGASINHTDYPAVGGWPIAISMETKPPHGGWTAATLQIGVWQAAHIRCLRQLRSCPEFLPGIVVQGHVWSFVASVPGSGGGKGAELYTSIPMGNTETPLGIYSIVASLRCLVWWIEHTYWPAFESSCVR